MLLVNIIKYLFLGSLAVKKSLRSGVFFIIAFALFTGSFAWAQSEKVADLPEVIEFNAPPLTIKDAISEVEN